MEFVGVSIFGFLAFLVEVELDLAEGFETSYEVVVEDTEICEWFRLRLTILLLCTIKELAPRS